MHHLRVIRLRILIEMDQSLADWNVECSQLTGAFLLGRGYYEHKKRDRITMYQLKRVSLL